MNTMILKALNELTKEQFSDFTFHLQDVRLGGKDPIQAGPLDGAKPRDVTKMITQKYPSDLQGQVMKIVLANIDRNDLVPTFEDTTVNLPETSGASSTQGTPDKTMLVTNKTRLVGLLSSDLYIIQHAQADGIINERIYTQLMALQPEAACIKLVDTVIKGGEGLSSKFLRLLKKPEILDTYPQLKEWP